MNATQTKSTYEIAAELSEIQTEILELLDRAKKLLHNAPRITRERAESYWLAHASMALTNKMVSMEDTIAELEGDES